jgi:NADH-quinone oxidoreductase subunit N
MGLTLAQAGQENIAFSGMVVLDGFSTFLDVLFLGTGLLGIALAYGYLRRMGIERGEYYALLLFSVTGMLLMAQAGDLIVIFLALELLSIPLYVLSAFARPRLESEEAGLKYFLLGAFSTGFVVYGIALVFGATGATNLMKIVSAAAGSGSGPTVSLPLLGIGAALILVGFGFKVAAVPFHMWTPDVYQGAPTPVTSFMAVGAKAAGFAALLRIFVTALPALEVDLVPVLWGLAALTMLVGNLLAISQSNIKRMLAYSSIAHAGYILMALAAYGKPLVSGDAVASALFYLVTYALTSFGTWAVVIALEKAEGKGLEIADYAGLGRKRPLLAAAMTIFMLSLTGMPPTLGLVGKFYLFRTAIQGGFIGLAIIGVLTSLISAYYYLRVVVTMYMRDGDPETTREPWLDFTWGLTALGTVVLSFLPMALFTWASGAVLKLF